jgi:hypothetical protein
MKMKNNMLLQLWKSISKDNFEKWFVGFSEGEGCFKIKQKYRGDKSKVHSFSFEFEIHLLSLYILVLYPLDYYLYDLHYSFLISPLVWYSNARFQKEQETKIKLNPGFITGFTDAEGSFIIRIQKKNKLKTGFLLRNPTAFSIHLASKDNTLLYQIKSAPPFPPPYFFLKSF